MPPLSGKQRKAQLKLKRAIKRGAAPPPPPQPPPRKNRLADATRTARNLQSHFVELDKRFLDHTRALAGSIILARPISSQRPKWNYQMSKEELDANEHACFRDWLSHQGALVQQWQRALNAPQSTPSAVLESSTRQMPHPPTHFETNIEVWRQFWRVTEISQILLVLLDSRCPPLHLPLSLSTYLNIPTSSSPQSLRSRQSAKSKVIILVLTKVDISGPARTASWTSFLNANYPRVRVVPVEAYASKSSFTDEQGRARYEPHLPDTFRERLVHTLRDAHEQMLHPPEWVTDPRADESEAERLQRIDRWRPRVKRVVNWEGLLKAKGKMIGKAVGGAAVPWGQDKTEGAEADEGDDEDEKIGDACEWKEPEFLTVGVIGQPNVGKSSLLNAIFGTTRVRASRTPGKTTHFQTLFWTSDVRLVDCPGLVMPSFVPMDIQVLSGVLPISRISAVPFCVHQLAQLLPLEQILGLTHPSLSTFSAASNATAAIASTSDHDSIAQCSKSTSSLVEDKRTWRPGRRPIEQTEVQSRPKWTANDIMTAYAGKKGWVTAKAGRPDVHRAGNAILRLVAEGKIPWAFWPPGSSVCGDDGIWLKDGVREDDEEEESETEEMSSEEEDSSQSDDSEEVGARGGKLGRFGALRIDVYE